MGSMRTRSGLSFSKHDSVLFNGVLESVHTRWRSCGPKQTKGSPLQATNTSADELLAIADGLEGQIWDFHSEALKSFWIALKSFLMNRRASETFLDEPPSDAPGLHHGSFFR